ncbi:MAG: rRNA maturation RNase YbeY [Actinomycetota bacterium]
MVEGKPSLGAPLRSGGDGVPEVFCVDEQSEVPIELERWRRLALNSLQSENVRGAAELAVLFVDEVTIAEMNAQFMGKSGPTDVLAFPVDGLEVFSAQGPGAVTRGPSRAEHDLSDAPLILGDVVICPAVAVRQAPEHAGEVDDEIALLLVHGILHVLGHDHDEPQRTAVMRAREIELLSAHHWNGPAPVGFAQEHSS